MVAIEDLDCSLCYRLLLEPITTPCGHVFCKECLYRSLDHNPFCPLCKEALCKYMVLRPQATTESLNWLMEKQFGEELDARKRNHLSELATAACRGEDIPIFVCTLAYPDLSCPLHVFEPRYRLMMRRCLESGARQFGMCVWLDKPHYSQIGTMLEIQDLRYLSDGRSVVTTLGRRRFKVQSRGKRDGYDVAKVQYISDKFIPQEKVQGHQLLETYDKCLKWFNGLAPEKRQAIINCYGNFPQFSRWLWYMVAILPLETSVKTSLLSNPSLECRLVTLQKVLNVVSSRNWR
uniref:RING-type domain-containing protein n=1 Tax=Helobdella robusta TaxID=6412 RepID=T1G0J0_HELRO